MRLPFVAAFICQLAGAVRVRGFRSRAGICRHSDFHGRICHGRDRGGGCDLFAVIGCDLVLHFNVVQAEPVIYVCNSYLGILVDRIGIVGIIRVVGIVMVVGIVRVVRIIRDVWNVGVVRIVRDVGVVRLFRQVLRLFFRRFWNFLMLLRVDRELRLRRFRVSGSGHCLRNNGGIGVCYIGFIPRIFLDAACGAKYDQ